MSGKGVDDDLDLDLFTDTAVGDVRDPYPALALARQVTPVQQLEPEFPGQPAGFMVYPHEQVAQVLRELDADVIALQEVVSLSEGHKEQNQARYLADAIGHGFHIGETRKLRGAAYPSLGSAR